MMTETDTICTIAKIDDSYSTVFKTVAKKPYIGNKNSNFSFHSHMQKKCLLLLVYFDLTLFGRYVFWKKKSDHYKWQRTF